MKHVENYKSFNESWFDIFRSKHTITYNEIVKKLSECLTMCDELVTAKRYDFKKVLNEKILTINSRLQDPKQKKDWIKNGASGKWQKDEHQDKTTLYIPNYGKCKL